MSTMNISLPEALKEFVDQQVEERGFSTTSEYLRDLIRKEFEKNKLREMILEGVNSPLVGQADAAYFKELRESLKTQK
ncbi:MAG: type II toxin-antitoxin system ParD family antitoxin [Chrysiogenetes bacterium]|nr:type II toxin-antitoxin system ParD family antitoxin [Chrysiogenetes bacterium]